jgi:hypothetical protein
LCLVFSSCGFSHLTDVQNQDNTGPSAKECGSCHVEQYAEWQLTAHARAFVSPQFKLESSEYEDEDCLFCHSPGNVLASEKESRKFNRNEGVTCIACHLHKESMQGPHQSGALFSPHAISKNSKVNSAMDSSQLCGVCHEETYEQWQNQQKNKQFPTCHGCHGVAVERAHTKGTNFFTKILVAFEPVHKVRSHYLILPNKPGMGIGPDLLFDSKDNNSIHFTLINSLPHDLPTGSYGERELFFVLNCLHTDEVELMKQKIIIPSILAAGEKKNFTAIFPKNEYCEDFSIDLFRLHQSTGKATLIREYPFTSTTNDKRK